MPQINIPEGVDVKIQNALRDVDKILDKLLTKDLQMNGRAITGLGRSRDRNAAAQVSQIQSSWDTDEFKNKVAAIVATLLPPLESKDSKKIFEFYDDMDTFAAMWTVQAGSVSTISATSNHPGVIRLASPASLNGIGRLSRSQSAAVGMSLIEEVDRFNWVVSPVTNTAKKIRLGFTENTGTVGGDNGIYFQHLTGAANWQFVTKTGAGSTATDTGVAFATSTWFDLLAVRISDTEWWAYIDDVLVAKNATAANVPTGAEVYCAMIETNDANAKQIDIDFSSVKSIPLGNRY